MNTDKHSFRPRAVTAPFALLGLVLASGCSVLPEPQADAVRYFTLSSGAVEAPVADAVLVRPVRLSGHLRNRNLAVRVSENEVVYVEDVRWAEPLDEAITQVLRSRLRQVPGGGSVLVHINRCELVRSEGSAVQLSATYTIAPPVATGGDGQPGAFTATPRPWSGSDYGELVGLIQASVNELADAIAAAAAAK